MEVLSNKSCQTPHIGQASSTLIMQFITSDCRVPARTIPLSFRRGARRRAELVEAGEVPPHCIRTAVQVSLCFCPAGSIMLYKSQLVRYFTSLGY
jgi:hypothetical protein